MQATYPFRLYANPWRPVFAILLMGADLVFGYWLIQTSNELALLGYAVLIVCCPLLAFYLALFVVRILLRRPVLEIDAREWRIWATPFGAPQALTWPDIGAVTITHQEGRSGYSLGVSLKTAGRASQVVATLPLNTLFLRMSLEHGEALLGSIYIHCRNEFAQYGVQVVPGNTSPNSGSLPIGRMAPPNSRE